MLKIDNDAFLSLSSRSLTNDRISHEWDCPLYRACLPPAKRSWLADFTGNRWLLLERLHILRDVYGSSETFSSKRWSGGGRNHQASWGAIWREPAAYFPGWWRCYDALHASTASHPWDHSVWAARRETCLHLLFAAQCQQEICLWVERACNAWA